MKRRSLAATALLLFALPSSAQETPPPLVINEIHYDENDKTERVEFIEIHNPTDERVSLAGWEITGGVDFEFPDTAAINAGSYLVVAENPDQLRTHLRYSNALGPWTGRLSNSGETVTLRDSQGAAVSKVDYRLGFPWPTVGDLIGSYSPSIQLLNPTLDTELGGSWRSARPTPGARNLGTTTSVPPQIRRVTHEPNQPRSADPVVITALVTDPDGVQSVALSYQLVRPGAYFCRYLKANTNGTPVLDSRYERLWTKLDMLDDGEGDDESAGDGIYTATIPGTLQRHRHLMRYRIGATDENNTSILVPYRDDPSPNFAFFTYDGTPDWTGRIRNGDSPVTFSGELMSSIPTYFLLTTSNYVNDSQFGGYGGSEYLWPGTLIYDGKIYDNIHYRPRGGVHRFQFGKNFWKFDFPRGHRFQARDEYGKKYKTKWSKLNFSSIVQQVNFGHRGEQGLFEGVGFRLFQLCGVQASNTHHVQFYVIDSQRESTTSQYDTDYYGLFLAIEQLDGQFLEEHDLPDGNLYKIEGHSGESNNQGPTQVKNRSDVSSFISTYRGSNPRPDWWEANLNIDKYLSYRTIVEGIHHYDIAYGKNYFYYHNPESDKFEVVPWDLDLTFANNMFGNGNHDFKSKVANSSAFNTRYQNRMREIIDLLYNNDEGDKLVDETVKFVWKQGEPSLVDADRRLWDNHPRLNHKDRYYDIASSRDFPGMMRVVKNYLSSRSRWMTSSILTHDRVVPRRPTIRYAGAAGHPSDDLQFTASEYSSPGRTPFAAIAWRVSEVHNPTVPNYDPTQPNIYEIDGAFEQELSTNDTNFTFPPLSVRVGCTYRARVRYQDRSGRWSHWSQPIQFTATEPRIADHLRDLRISEFMYHPPEPTGSEREISTNRDDFEYVEVKNVGPASLDLRDVRFTKGIDFDFSGSAIETLEPGDYALLVKNRTAFEARYGAGLPIAGEYADDNLRNSGERLKLSYGAGTPIHDIDEYSDQLPWPTAADGGYSLVLMHLNQQEVPDHNDPTNWRISRSPQGSPGAEDGLPLSVWKQDYGFIDDHADGDGDGLVALLEYFLGGNPTQPSSELIPTAGLQAFAIDEVTEPYLTLSFSRQVTADEVNYVVEFSNDLLTWTEGGVLVSQTPSGRFDGLVQEVWRSEVPHAESPHQYARLRVQR